MSDPAAPRRAGDPARSRFAILLGSLLVALLLCCCLVTLLGWTGGAFRALDPQASPGTPERWSVGAPERSTPQLTNSPNSHTPLRATHT